MNNVSLLYNARKVANYARNPIKMLGMVYEELTAIDSRVDAKDAIAEQYQVYIPADSAANATFEHAIFKAPAAGTITDIIVVPDSDIGQATDFMVLTAQDKGADGTGTTAIGTRNVNSSNTIEGMVGVDIVTTNAVIGSGRVISLAKTVEGGGQAWPGGTIIVVFTPSA